MDNNNKLLKQSEFQENDFNNIKLGLIVAFERTGSIIETENQINYIAETLINEFAELNSEQIIEALRNGGLGKYGRTYKLTIQEICIWIRTYIKDNSPIKAFHPKVYE